MQQTSTSPRHTRGINISHARRTQLLENISFLQELDSKVLDKLRERAFVRRFEPGDLVVVAALDVDVR